MYTAFRLLLLILLPTFASISWCATISQVSAYHYDAIAVDFSSVNAGPGYQNYAYDNINNLQHYGDESLVSSQGKALEGAFFALLGDFLATKRGLRGHPGYKNALGQFKNTDLSNAGRALTKHPEVVGATKQNLRQGLRTDAQINSAAADALKNIMRNGVKSTSTHPRYGEIVTHQLKGGFGARFNAKTNEFIGFINP